MESWSGRKATQAREVGKSQSTMSPYYSLPISSLCLNYSAFEDISYHLIGSITSRKVESEAPLLNISEAIFAKQCKLSSRKAMPTMLPSWSLARMAVQRHVTPRGFTKCGLHPRSDMPEPFGFSNSFELCRGSYQDECDIEVQTTNKNIMHKRRDETRLGGGKI